ncbi:MAG: hypothetical protein R6V13_10120 [Anaerolineae bacterium]
METKAALASTITHIRERWGPEAIHKASTYPPALSTGYESLDRLLRIGGLPMGRLCELVSRATAGRTVLLGRTLHAAQEEGHQIVYVDVEHGVDLPLLSQGGVDFEALTVLRPASLQQALGITHDVARRGHGEVIVFDRLPPSTGTNSLARRWHAALGSSGCTLLILSEAPTSCSVVGVRLLLEREEWLHCRGRIWGCRSRATVLKNAHGPPGRSTSLTLAFHHHISGGDDETHRVCLDSPLCRTDGIAAAGGGLPPRDRLPGRAGAGHLSAGSESRRKGGDGPGGGPGPLPPGPHGPGR